MKFLIITIIIKNYLVESVNFQINSLKFFMIDFIHFFNDFRNLTINKLISYLYSYHHPINYFFYYSVVIVKYKDSIAQITKVPNFFS